MGAQDPPVLVASRILNASRVAQEADDTDVTGWLKTSEFIVVAQIDEQKGPWTAQYMLRWRDVTDEGAFAELAAAGEIKQGTATDLVNGNAVVIGEKACDNTPDGSWQDGEEVEGASTCDSIVLADEAYTEIHFACNPGDADAGHEYEFQLWDATNGASIGTLLAGITIASGQTFYKTCEGSLTPAGAVVRKSSKFPSGSLTPSGALTRLTSKYPSGSLTPVGVLARMTSKFPVGSITPSGVLATARMFTKLLEGSVTPVGVISRLTSKYPLGSVTPTGSVSRQTSKYLLGSTTPSGALSKGIFKSLTGSLTPSGILETAVLFTQDCAGSLTPVGDLVRKTLKMLSGSVSAVGVIQKSISKGVNGSLTPSGGVLKKTSKSISGSVAPTGILTTAYQTFKSIAGSITAAGDLATQYIAGGDGDAIYHKISRWVWRGRQ